jgi:hypothetical protein
MVLAPQVRDAFDLGKVTEDERFRYGYHTFGQSVLMAKQLSQAGVQLVTVYWHREKKTVDSTWDTHALNFQELKQRLMPSVDRPIAALLEDLAQSGELDDTLVVWNSEFGRTPKVNGRAGRDHWGPCNTVVMAGGGVPGGQIYGASDDRAAYPTANKVTQDDIAATMYHLLGFHPEAEVHDRLGRPHRVSLGEPIYELLGGEVKAKPTSDPVPVTRPQLGEFTRMLRERGNRHLTCNLGSKDGESTWDLSGWSAPQGKGLAQHRLTTKPGPSILKFTGDFYTHFDYSHIVLRLAEPRPLTDVVLTVSGKPLPISEALKPAEPKQVWQFPLPAGMVQSIKTLELSIKAKDLPVTDFAIVGDRIRDLHLARLA